MKHAPSPVAHSLPFYYALTSANSICMTIFVATVFFWTRAVFHYSDSENLWLSMCLGLSTVPGAAYGGRLSDAVGPDRLLFAVLAINAILLLTGWLPDWHYAPFVLAFVYGLVISASWPALESAVFHAPSRLTKPQRIAAYNITWASANTVGLMLSSLIVGWQPSAVVWVPGLLHAFSLAFLMIRRAALPADRERVHKAPAPATDSTPPRVKRRFMHTAWLGNALTYVMIAVLLPLLPALGERFACTPRQVILMACAFYLARSVAFFLFGRWERWHYHRGWNLAALLVAPLAFAGIMLTAALPLMVMSLAVFGVALGLTYSASIFYSLDYGEGKAEHGGLHEAVIGIGNLAGPLAGLAGAHWIGGNHGAALATLAIVAAGTLIAALMLPREQASDYDDSRRLQG